MILRAKDEASGVFAKVKSNAGGLADGIGKIGSGLALAGGAIGGIMAIGGAIASTAQSMIGGNVEMETYQTQLGTLLGSSDAAAERIKQLAKIGAETPFDLPQLVAAEKIMAGFGLTTEKTTQLTGRSLDDYRREIGDMAAATGAPLDEVTLLWSKFGSGATGEAISRLQELGIVTREQMAEMGIQFSKSGELTSPIPEAMAVAMDLAKAKMGGGMKALSSTFAGQMSTLADNFGQAKVILMQPIFDVLKTSLEGLNEALSSEAFTDSIKSMAESAAVAIDWLIGLFINLGSVLRGDVAGNLEAAAEMLGEFLPADAIDPIINMVYGLGEAFRSVMDGDILGAVQGATRILEDFGSFIAAIVEDWAASFAAWIDGTGEDIAFGLGDILIVLTDWLIRAGFAIAEKLVVWGAAFVDWIAPKIPGILAALGNYLTVVGNWLVNTALPFMVAKLTEWGAAFVEWVAPRIGPLLAALGGLLVALGGWLLGTALPAIVSKLLQWGDAFTAWVMPMIPLLIAQLVLLQIRLVGWIAEQVAGLATALVAWGVAFIAWIATDVIPALPGALAAILSAITGWIASTAGSLREGARGIGQAIIDGITSGISAGVAAIQNAAASAANSALEAAKNALGIESPSRRFNREVGQEMMRGAIGGINAQRPALMAATKAAMVPAVAAAAEVVASLSEQANAMAEAARQQAMAASKAGSMSEFLDSVQGLGDVFGQGVKLPTAIFGPRADEKAWNGTLPLPDPIFRPTTAVSDRLQPIFQPQPVVNLTVQGSLVHERELDRLIGDGLFNTLRRDGGGLGSR